MKKGALDYLGYGLAGLLLALLIYALLYLLWINPFYEASSYEIWGASEERGRYSEEEEKRFDGTIRNVSVENVGGSIAITGWDEDYVSVKFIKTARSQEHLDNLDVKVAQVGSRLTLQRSSRIRRSSGSISFEISVPGMVKEIAAKSVSGRVQLQRMGVDMDQKLSTVSGSIHSDNAANIDAHSVSGSIECVLSGRGLKVDTTSGQIDATILAIEKNGAVDINSVSGSVTLHVFDELDATVDIHSVSGSIDSELPIALTSSKRNHLEGVIGAGGVPFEVGTISGSIRIKKL